MLLRRVKFYLLFLCFTVSCATPPIAIKIIEGKSVGDSNCESLKRLNFKNEEGDEATLKHDINKAVNKIKGDTFLLEERVRNGKITEIYGTAYRCETSAE